MSTLLPPLPPNMHVEEDVCLCTVCRGAGMLVYPSLYEDYEEVCWRCGGRGYRVMTERIVQVCREPFPPATD